MTDLQTVFYIIAIIYMIFNILVLLGVIVGIYFIFRTITDIRRRIIEKMEYVDKLMSHPEEAIANIAASLIRNGFQGIKGIFRRVKPFS